ncbi:hypothetical protein PAECIP111893_04179 [Paenibacillus plantiphilus]|uniref:Uncharacterized protein n=1 Tax=Paenibacillus plantiphilus TaxID=2905650 RepID=A0ABN8GWW7_9BACL|nr:hypothetical protein PAECIP111893_04179 [Paenibacillus plantiphilus]
MTKKKHHPGKMTTRLSQIMQFYYALSRTALYFVQDSKALRPSVSLVFRLTAKMNLV